MFPPPHQAARHGSEEGSAKVRTDRRSATGVSRLRPCLGSTVGRQTSGPSALDFVTPLASDDRMWLK